MTVRLYDSKAQALRDFVPLTEGHVGMYVCGPTVQSSPHIGHLRSALAYDLMRRWFAARADPVDENAGNGVLLVVLRDRVLCVRHGSSFERPVTYG